MAFYAISPHNSLFFVPGDSISLFWGTVTTTEFERVMIGRNIDPNYVYDVLLYLKEIDNYSEAELRTVIEKFYTATPATATKVIESIKSIGNPNMRLWSAYRNILPDPKILFRLEGITLKPHTTRFLLNVRNPEQVIAQDMTKGFYNPDAAFDVIDIRTTANRSIISSGIGYFTKDRFESIFSEYKNGSLNIKVDGLTETVSNSEYENIILKNEDLRFAILLAQQNMKKSMDYANSSVQYPLDSQILENISTWPYDALKERANRSTNILLIAASKWFKRIMSSYVRRIVSVGWNRDDTNPNGKDIINNITIDFISTIINPITNEFIPLFKDVDPISFPQTIEEAKEIVFEYLQYRLFYNKERSDPITVAIIQSLRNMIVSFPFKDIVTTADHFMAFYVGLSTSDTIKRSMQDIKDIDIPWFNNLLQYWNEKVGERIYKEDSTDVLSGFWVEYHNKSLEKRVTDYLDTLLYIRITSKAEFNTEYGVLYFYFAFFTGLLYYRYLFLNPLIAATAESIKYKAYMDLFVYDAFISLATIPHQSTWNRIVNEIHLIANLSTVMDEWYAKLKTKNNLFAGRVEIIQKIYNKIGVRVSNANRVAFTDYIRTVVDNYLKVSLTPSMIPEKDITVLETAKKNFTSWFSFYTNKNEYPIISGVSRQSDLSYSLYANQMLLQNGIIPPTVEIPKHYTIKSTERQSELPLDIVAKFVPENSISIRFVWKMRPVRNMHSQRDEDIIVLKVQTERMTNVDESKTYPNVLTLTYPITSGIYWCTVEALDNAGLILASGDSVTIVIMVEKLCPRCKRIYTLHEVMNIDPFLNLSIRENICDWYIIPKHYNEVKEKRKYSDSKYYDIHTIIEDLIQYIITGDTTQPAVEHRISPFGVTLLSIDEQADYLTQLLAKDNLVYFATYSEETLNLYSWFHDAFVYRIPYRLMLLTLMNFCNMIISENVPIGGNGIGYYLHFRNVIKKLQEIFSVQSQMYSEDGRNKRMKLDWITEENKSAFSLNYIKWHNLPLYEIEKTKDFVFDREGYERATKSLYIISRQNTIYPIGNEAFHYYGKHTLHDELPDELKILNQRNDVVFSGFGFVSLDNPADLIRDIMSQTFTFPSLTNPSNDIVAETYSILKISYGSVLLFKKDELLRLKSEVEELVKDVNQMIAQKIAAIIPDPSLFKKSVEAKLRTLMSNVYQYNRVLYISQE